MADWQEIKTEYVTTNTSYRKLSEKYGVHVTQIGRRAKDEGWVQLRQQNIDETLTKTLNAISAAQVKRAVRLHGVTDKLLDKIEKMMGDKSIDLDTQALKHISGILKDIKEIQMIRSEGDLQEQQARIDKLRADAARGAKDTVGGLVVSLEGEMGEYGQ